MSSKSLAALAFVCLAPVAAFAQTAPAAAPVPVAKAPAAVTMPAPAATAPTVAPAAKVTAPATTATTPATTPATTAAAPADGQGSKRWQTCAGDVQKFCGSVEKGKGAIRTCLESHATELTPACKTSMAEHAAAHASKTGEQTVAPAVKQ